MTDDFESGYQATKHLIECGCKKIALLSISNHLSISNKRLEGYKQALVDHSIPFDPLNLIYCGNEAASNYRFIRKILHDKDRPDGILATVEKLTTKVYLACQELSLRIPEDIKIVSFSNLSAASILNPSLTTITQPAFEIGKSAATILFKSLDRKSFQLENIREVIPSELIIRGSTVAGK